METMETLKKRTLLNLKAAFVSQLFSFLVSMIMSIVVPKVIDVEQFSYWQLFLFYANYVGLFLFGLNDGIYLRIGGKTYSEINKSLLGTQFKLSVIMQSVVMLLIMLYAKCFETDIIRALVLVRVAVYLIIFNLHGFLGYIMQAVNLVNKYSKSIIIEKAIFCIIIIGLIWKRTEAFTLYVDAYIMCKAVSFVYLMIVSRELLFSKMYSLKTAFFEIKTNISIGIHLMIANISNSMILGIGRFLIDKRWDVITFGKVSLALSLVNFFLIFISQTSIVLFPALRCVTQKQLVNLYHKMRLVLGVTLSSVFFLYIPIKILVSWWLPQYEKSIYYLIFLLPICTYDGKMNIMCSTFFKVLRREKILLAVNVSSMFVSLMTVYTSAVINHNLNYVLIGMTFSVAFRCILSEIVLSKVLHVNVIKEIMEESILVIIFILSSLTCNNLSAFLVNGIMYIIYIWMNRNRMKQYLPERFIKHNQHCRR